MQTIAFFISNHGFGHIMRNVPVIAWLLENTEDRVILVTASAHVAAAKNYVKKYAAVKQLDRRFICIERDTDLGLIVKAGTLLVDEVQLQIKVKKYIEQFPEQIRWGRKMLEEYEVDKAVVDIVPWALSASKEAGIPSYFMASFTWMEQYIPHLPEKLVEPFRRCFADADNVLLYRLATSQVKQLYTKTIPVGLCARSFHLDQVEQIRKMANGKPIVYVSIGMNNDGICEFADVSQLPYCFIVTEGVNLTGDNVHTIPRETDNTQDYVMAADFCIAKAGWTTIAEILIAGKPVALLSRPDVVEDCEYIRQLVEQKLAIEISVAELSDVKTILDTMEQMQWAKADVKNDAVHIAEIIRG